MLCERLSHGVELEWSFSNPWVIANSVEYEGYHNLLWDWEIWVSTVEAFIATNQP
jgi:hypothetical protein